MSGIFPTFVQRNLETNAYMQQHERVYINPSTALKLTDPKPTAPKLTAAKATAPKPTARVTAILCLSTQCLVQLAIPAAALNLDLSVHAPTGDNHPTTYALDSGEMYFVDGTVHCRWGDI